MHIHQIILHGCSSALHLELDLDPGGSIVATRTSGEGPGGPAPSALDILGENSYWSLRMLRGDDWDCAAIRRSVGAIARTHPRRPLQPLLRRGGLTLLDLEQVFFDPTGLDCEEIELFLPENTGHLLHSLGCAARMGFATAVQTDAEARLRYKDTRFIYQDGRDGAWNLVFWGADPGFERALLPQPAPMPAVPPTMATYLSGFF